MALCPEFSAVLATGATRSEAVQAGEVGLRGLLDAYQGTPPEPLAVEGRDQALALMESFTGQTFEGSHKAVHLKFEGFAYKPKRSYGGLADMLCLIESGNENVVRVHLPSEAKAAIKDYFTDDGNIWSNIPVVYDQVENQVLVRGVYGSTVKGLWIQKETENG